MTSARAIASAAGKAFGRDFEARSSDPVILMTEGSMDTIFTRLDATPARSPNAGALPAFSRWLKACLARSRQRRDLGLLSEEQLRDIGLTAADVDRECRRWPWDGAASTARGGVKA